jgi:hypothetical protein
MHHFLRRTEENGNFSQGSRCPSRDLNLIPPDYEARAPPLDGDGHVVSSRNVTNYLCSV